ncbi:MAG: type II secretion system GspH family protein [Candidatus Curtissbacteria bacterium]|nr:type II secretion system GspH family protein [Candidatus Curtissbacteria bacterium]
MPFLDVHRRSLIAYRRTLSFKTIVDGRLTIVSRSGYTLIEFLIVLGILTIVVGSTLVFLTSVLQGSNQTNITTEIKQNGQAVLESLDSKIRSSTFAEEDVMGSGKYIKLTTSASGPLHIKCFSDTEPKSVNGWIGTSTLNQEFVPESSYVPLTNRDLLGGVDISNCSFKVNSASAGALNPAVVSVSFTVNQAIGAPSRQDFKANVEFDTTVSLRSY